MEITAAMKAGFSQEYSTHLNYVHCMVGMMHQTELKIPVNKAVEVSKVDTRRYLKLAELTRKSIQGEIENCRSEIDYVQIAAPWLAVKCYYRLYYLESVLIHISTGATEVFKNTGHNYVRKIIRTFCKNGYITTKMRHAESIEPYGIAVNHKVQMGMNLKQDYYLSEECVKSVRSKLTKYSIDHWKKNSKYKAFRSRDAKHDLAEYITRGEVSLFDFFYQMRVKANYRDADFLDFNKITAAEGLKYIEYLKAATDKYANALTDAINNAIKQRSTTT